MEDFEDLNLWEKKRSSQNNEENLVKIAFRSQKNIISADVNVSKDVFSKISVSADDFVQFFFTDKNRKVLYIKKAEDSKSAHRVRRVMSSKTRESNFLRIVFKCWLTSNELTEEDKSLRRVPYKIENDFLIVDASLSNLTSDRI